MYVIPSPHKLSAYTIITILLYKADEKLSKKLTHNNHYVKKLVPGTGVQLLCVRSLEGGVYME